MATPVAPYYQRYDKAKKFVQLLALPGRVAQASEWNDLGAMFLDFLASLGDSMYASGNIISGCEISIINNRVKISEGKIYLEGLVRDVEAQEFDIQGSGSEMVNAYIEESIITESEDTDLYDPAAGTENYGQPGVHARKQVVKFGVNIPDKPVVWELKDGVVLTTVEGNNEFDTITQVLARRTYDESGNYRVSGLQMRAKGTQTNGKLDVTLTEGKAYVLGYEVTKPTATTFQIDKANTTREVIGETHPMSASNTTKQFQLSNHPVAIVNQITVTLQITEDVTRGSITGGIDYLPHSPVFEIDTVKQNGTTYVRGTDWQRSGDAIDWSLLGSEPAIGSRYQVTYRYNKTLTTDEFSLNVNYDTGKSVVTLLNDTPFTDSLVYFNYEFYLARKDIIMIDKDGRVVPVKGEPDILRMVSAPTITDDSMLQIGTITVPANQDTLGIVNLSIEASTMEDIQKTIQRVEDLEYNQAVTDLDKEAEEGEPATELRGILTDKFIGFTKADVGHPQFDAAMDIDKEELTLPSNGSVSMGSINEGSFDTSYGSIGTTITAPYTERRFFAQELATRSMLVNPYAVFDPVVPVVATPNVDNWIEQSTIEVTDEKVKTTSLRRWWWHGGASWVESEKQAWRDLGFSDSELVGSWDNKKKTNVKVNTEVLDKALPFIRVRDVAIKAYGFEPLSDNIKCYFDDRLVALTPAAQDYRGTEDGTAKADGTGTVNAKFTIPENVPCGTKSIKLVYAGDSMRYGKTGTTTYTANGRLHEVKKTILKETVIVSTVDPLAQSFQFDEEIYLTSVDLYFATKDPVLPITVQIRNVVNGYPGNIGYAEAILPAADIKVSSDASLATKCTFTNAVKLAADTQYCLVVMSDSNLPALWVARLGETEVRTKALVTSNPYTAGVLFSSSNALTWTAHQDMDMKLSLYRAEFQGRGSIAFNDIPVNQADRFVLAIDSMSPADTSMKWYFKVNGQGSWEPIDIFDERETSVVATKIALKAEFQAQPTRSPMISSENLCLAHFLNKQEARYISRNVFLDEGFNNIKVYLDVTAIQNTDFKVYYATDVNGETWVELTNPTRTNVDEEYVRYLWTKSLSGTEKNFRLKIVLTTTNVLNRPRAKRMMCILKTV